MNILGINAYHGDASAAILIDGLPVAAAEEERFTRIKHDTSFPIHAIEYCLRAANLRAADLDHIAISRNPRAKLARRVSFALTSRAGRRMAPQRIANIGKLMNARESMAAGLGVSPKDLRAQIHFVEHHQTHLASSFFVSPFERSAVISIDGFGDMVSAKWGVGNGNHISMSGEVGFPHSLGVWYTAVTQYLGFPKYGDEYKVMGLASYGEPEYLDQMRRVVTNDGLTFRLNLEYFRHHREGASMTWAGGVPELGPLWGPGMVRAFGPARAGGQEPLDDRHRNLASSLQRRLEEVELSMLRELHRQTGVDDLCLSGGVALNCVVNGKVFHETPFRRVYVPPAASDAGTSLGAALHVHHQLLGNPREYVMEHAYLGPEYSDADCRQALDAGSIDHQTYGSHYIIERTAEALSEGKIVGWFQGRMEFGPRALGNRSILADPRRHDMKDILNARIKHREPFRPFAPSILEEATGDYFEQSHPSPFMTLTYRVRQAKLHQIPAPTHVDGTGRLQTVRRDQNPLYYDLIDAFRRRTGVPVLLNTSFNENEPICNKPQEAAECFQRTRMDVLVLGDRISQKAGVAAHPQ